MKREITVAVTGLNNVESPGPGIPVIRALRDSAAFDVRVVGLSYDTLEPGLYMHDLVDKSYQLPFPSAGKDVLLDRLRYVQARENIDVLIPNFDAELNNFILLESALRDGLNIRTYLPTMEQFEDRHKVNLNKFGQRCGVDVPRSKMVFNASEIPSLATAFDFPFMMKGKYYDAGVAQNVEQARALFHKLAAKWGLPVIAQEHVAGHEVNVTALGDGTGRTVGAVPMRKQYVTDKGKAWAGITIDDPALLGIARRVVADTAWRGGLELEFIKTADNQYKLLEINPRFPAWVYLTVGAGQNHPEALLRLALGDDVEPFGEYEKGKLFVRYSYDLIVDLKEFETISTTGEL